MMSTASTEPECLPLRTLEDVLQWTPGHDAFSVGTVPLSPRPATPCQHPRTLVCHDMAGGYLDDRFVQGVKKDNCYRFSHWSSIDSFIYFSHHFVTIPPPCWTNPAHKNGVLMLGTIITEWDEGAQRCRDMFVSEQSAQNVADKLVEIAAYYRFDGWLINIENPIKSHEIVHMKFFVRYLTEKMHSAIAHSQVIWYDSVIETGQLRWQDEVNDKNSMFFDACDGIFLNYCWKDDNLLRSAELSRKQNRPFDVYVGVDVFGRGCLGGGGYNTKEALEAAQKHNMSVAIFAPGWVYEKLGSQDFTDNQNKFWKLLEPYLQTRTLTHLPVFTSFGQGFGNKFYLEGKIYSEQPWTNQSVQPLQCNWSDLSGATLCLDDAYSGGGCLQLATKNKESNIDLQKLFSCNILLPEQTFVSYTYKLQSNCDIFLQLACHKPDGTSVYLYLMDNAVVTEDIMKRLMNKGEILKPLSPDSLPKCWQNSTCEHVEQSWNTRIYSLNAEKIQGNFLKEISACCYYPDADGADVNTETYTALLGQLKILSAKDVHNAGIIPPLSIVCDSTIVSSSNQAKSGNEGEHEVSIATGDANTHLDTMLSWDDMADIDHYNIFYRQLSSYPSGGDKISYTYHGTAMLNSYKICQLDLVENCRAVEFCVQPIARLGFCDQLDACKPCVIHID